MKSHNTARILAENPTKNLDSGSSVSDAFSFSEREFDEVREIIKQLTGISIGASKHQLVRRRLQSRLRATGISTVEDYLAKLKTGDSQELEAFSNAVTTNLTSFFRERHHFDYLSQTIIPEIVTAKGHTSRRLRIWSAGCSTGEEPYSIAITLKEALQDIASWDAKILATDLDTNVLSTAKAGIYKRERVEKIPPTRMRRWFNQSRSDNDEQVVVNQELQNLTAFKPLNLMHKWPMQGRFDVIFCRNVVIYFDKATQRKLVERFANVLEDGGYLILGHSESLFKVSSRFTLLGETIYRKNA